MFGDDDNKNLADSAKPFYTVNKKNEEDKLAWLTETKNRLMNESYDRTQRQRVHLRAYLGLNPVNESVKNRGYLPQRGRRRNPRFPHIHDIIETKVSQMTRLKPDIQVLPADDEYSDRGAAKVAQQVVRNIFEQQQLDARLIELHRQARIFGEAYMLITFDKNIGDFDKEYVRAKELGVEGLSKMPKRIGDVKYETRLPWKMFLQRKQKLDDCEYYLTYCIKPRQEVMDKYGAKEEDFGGESEVVHFNTSNMQDETLEDTCVVWEFYHKRTEFLPEGKMVKFVENKILEETEYPYSMDEFNFVRLTDIDVPDILNGVSKLEFALPMQLMFDNLTAIAARNLFKTAYSKWAVPRAAKINPDSLADDNTLVTYAGPVPPALIAVQPSPPELYSFREAVKNDMQVLMGNHGISRGEVPKGITASSALQFLTELESERASSDISKHATIVKEISKKSIAIAADFYNPDDERLVRIVGKNNKTLIKHFDNAVLSRPYDIRFDSSSGFPETIAAKRQRVLESMQFNREMLSPERWQYLLDLGDTDKLSSIMTSAIESAEAENEDILSGEYVAEPEFYEDHIAHLRSHYAALQPLQFKQEADDEILVAMLNHIAVHEKLAIEKAKTNALYSAELANIKMFPITPGLAKQAQEVVMSLEQRAALVQGEANRGEEVSTQIPGTDNDGGQ